MKNCHYVLGLIASLVGHSVWAQEVANADFAQGLAKWSGNGKVAYLAPDGSISSNKSDDATPLIQIDLSLTQWRGIKQRLLPKPDDTSVTIELDVKASSDFQIAESSREYSDEVPREVVQL